MKQCDCEFCKESKRMREIVARLPGEDAKWLTEFYNKHLNLAMDEEYNRHILNGSWPSSVRILTRALEEAKKNKENTK